MKFFSQDPVQHVLVYFTMHYTLLRNFANLLNHVQLHYTQLRNAHSQG
jgi:hypothetical protein